jgi:hypothetical protein
LEHPTLIGGRKCSASEHLFRRGLGDEPRQRLADFCRIAGALAQVAVLGKEADRIAGNLDADDKLALAPPRARRARPRGITAAAGGILGKDAIR